MLQEIGPETTTGDIAVSLPSSIAVFERHRIDFCCGGSRPLAQAADEAGADLAGILEELGGLQPEPDDRDWGAAPLNELLDHILATHHRFTKDAVGALGPLAGQVVAAHGAAHAELREVQAVADELFREISMHLRKEEEVLFPMIRALAEEPHPDARKVDGLGGCAYGNPEMPMQVMEAEHDHAARLLRRLRSLTRDYAPPADACEKYQALLKGLEGLEQDLHRHIHLENNALHPRTRALLA